MTYVNRGDLRCLSTGYCKNLRRVERPEAGGLVIGIAPDFDLWGRGDKVFCVQVLSCPDVRRHQLHHAARC